MVENEKKSLAKDGEGKIIFYIKYRWSFLSEENKLYFEFIYFKLRVFLLSAKLFVFAMKNMMNFSKETFSKNF